ncbi:hypothetical protein D9757_012220 [Collybiopsis confluens]|uniref:Cyclin N-terminal domain-containing protein n=1 Tax=Collybiopsis confluens TaxID=2823264 RepID=A0A8H5GLH1_9AGAR|nr:hypothetical protein D9757_012220 [Collybiopsis confluens]
MFFSSSSPSSSSSSASSSSSSIHPSSLVSPSMHSQAILDLVDVKLSKHIIEYVVDSVADTVDFAMGKPSPARGRSSTRRPELAKFTTFVSTVLERAEVTTPVVLASLAYIDRARPHLHIALEEWALERVFLGALIVASKYLNDSTLKNVHWALCTGVFGKRDVGRIEREFLDVLDWELAVSEADILAHHAGVSAIIAPSPPPSKQLSPRHHNSRVAIRQTSRHNNHHHRYQAHRTSCPDLEPSDPMSDSDASSSPQTPLTLNVSPESFMPSSSSSSSAIKIAPSSSSSSTAPLGIRELIRSFPIPSHSHHHHPQTQFPIRV